MTTQPGSPGRWIGVLLLAMLLAIAGACGSGDDEDSDTGFAPAAVADVAEDEPEIAEDAPEPVPINEDEIEILEEWQEVGVPRFRDGEVLDFEPHASRVANGGTLLLDGLNATPEEIIGYYRGAFQTLGWEERQVSDDRMTAESDVANLVVTVNVSEEQTLIMMILTDRVGAS